jgi:hypothetical protein
MRYLALAIIGLSFAFFYQTASAADQLEQLLLFNPWCTFKYDKVTGYSNETMIEFLSNGTYATGRRSEGYSIGKGGTLGSQSDNRSYGRWKVVEGILYIAEQRGRKAS